MGAGAIGMGLLVGWVGYSGMFLLTAGLAVTALLPAGGSAPNPAPDADGGPGRAGSPRPQGR